MNYGGFKPSQRLVNLTGQWAYIMLKLKLKLKTNLYSAMESGGTSRLSSQREYGEIEMF